MNSSLQLRERLVALMEQGQAKFIINLAGVPDIDSSGLVTLIELFQRIKQRQGALLLGGISEKIRNVFKITKLNKVFKVFTTEKEAIAGA